MKKSLKKGFEYKGNLINSLYFMVPSIVAMFIQLFTTPVFARNLSPLDFSIIGYFSAINAIYTSIINFSLFSYYMRGFHARSDQENESVISSIVLFLAAANVVFLGINYLAWSVYFSRAAVSFPIFPYLLIVFFTSFMTVYSNALFMYYKMYKQPTRFMWYSITSTVINIGLGLLLVVGLGMGAQGKLFSIMVSHTIVGVVALKTLCRQWHIDWNVIREAFKLGYPLVIMALLNIPMTQLDKIILEQNRDVVNYSFYTIGMQFAGYLMMMHTSIFQAFEPDLYRFANTSRSKLKYLIFSFLGVLLLSVVMFMVFSKPVIGFLTSYRYTGAARFANVFVWSNLFLMVSYVITTIFVARGKTPSLLLRKVIVSATGTGLLYLLIHLRGFYGAAYARVMINFFDCLVLLMIGAILIRRTRIDPQPESTKLQEVRETMHDAVEILD